MTEKKVVLFLALVLVLGWSLLAPGAAKSSEDEKGIPVIIQSFASKELRAGDNWKVYLKASDPEGKMRYIFATISQPGVGTYPVSITKINGENQRELSGYVYLNTMPIKTNQFFNLTLTLTVNIKDSKGQFSKPAVFPLTFEAKAEQEAPPDGVFKEQSLGPIMITLRTVSGTRRR